SKDPSSNAIHSCRRMKCGTTRMRRRVCMRIPPLPGFAKSIPESTAKSLGDLTHVEEGGMSTWSQEKRTALAWIDAEAERLSRFAKEIWTYAEPAFREYKSAKAYCALLRSEGFEVEEGSGDMPTAFVATYGAGKPILGSYAEYDAVPENSQQPVPHRAPR